MKLYRCDYLFSGTSGKHIRLISNYFPIMSYTNWNLYQYRVEFSPEISSTNMQRALLRMHKERLGVYIFDGTILFSSVKYEPDVSNVILLILTKMFYFYFFNV